MVAVRNFCIARGSNPTGVLQTIYTVPAGAVLLVKQIILANTAASPLRCLAYVSRPPSSPTIAIIDATVAPGLTQQLTTWTCLNPGDLLLVAAGAPGMTYWCSGALLTPYDPSIGPQLPQRADPVQPLPAGS